MLNCFRVFPIGLYTLSLVVCRISKYQRIETLHRLLLSCCNKADSYAMKYFFGFNYTEILATY